MPGLTANTTRRDFLKSLVPLSVPVFCQGSAADTDAPAAATAQVLAAVEKIRQGVREMQTTCSYTPIEKPTHLLVVLRQMHEFRPSEALRKTTLAQGSAPAPNLDAIRQELLQVATFLRREASLKDIFCEAVSAEQLAELSRVVAELKATPLPARLRELQSGLGSDFSKCELIAQSGLTLHAAESRDLNRVVSELNERGLLVVKEAQRMSEIKSGLERRYPLYRDIPGDQLRIFNDAADRVTKSSEQFVAFWNSPETQTRIFEKRELFALDQICRLFSSNHSSAAATTSCPGAVLLYGGNHDFKRHLARIHREHPTLRIAFIELTPKSYRESSIGK